MSASAQGTDCQFNQAALSANKEQSRPSLAETILNMENKQHLSSSQSLLSSGQYSDPCIQEVEDSVDSDSEAGPDSDHQKFAQGASATDGHLTSSMGAARGKQGGSSTTTSSSQQQSTNSPSQAALAMCSEEAHMRGKEIRFARGDNFDNQDGLEKCNADDGPYK